MLTLNLSPAHAVLPNIGHLPEDHLEPVVESVLVLGPHAGLEAGHQPGDEMEDLSHGGQVPEVDFNQVKGSKSEMHHG